MIRLSLSAVMLFSLTVLAPPVAARAQSAVTQSDSSGVVNRLDAKQVGITHAALAEHSRHNETAPAATTAALVQSRVRRGQTLMIVGGAAFLAGLIIGDDVGTAIAVGGALVGIYGLYLWAQTQ